MKRRKSSKKKCEKGLRKLRKVLKDHIRRQCLGDVAGDYDELKEPSREVHPKLLWVLKFYEGGLLRMMLQCQKDGAFKDERLFSSAEELDYETFFRRVIETEDMRISVIGQAGSGKTVMLKRLVRDLLRHDEDLLIFFLNFRDFTDSEDITPSDFLLGGLIPDSDVSSTYEWILENQDKVVFVFDGLDQATWLVDEKAKLIRPYGSGKVSEIMSNIFNRKLFSDVKVVYSSREHAVASLTDKLRPKIVVALNGLSRADSEWLFKSFLGEDGEKLWEKLRLQSHSVIPLLSTPAFLIFTAIVYKTNPVSPPRFMTEVLQNLLEIFMQSGHIVEKDIPSVMNGLKKLSFIGMKDGRVLFYLIDIENAGLDPEKICDWIIKMPGLNKCNQFLLEGKNVLLFSHQILQEFLAGQYIIEADFDTFQEIVNSYLKEDAWSVVTRFVSGLLLNDEIDVNLDAVTDLDQRRNTFKNMIAKKYIDGAISQNFFTPCSNMEILSALSESNQIDFIKDLVCEIRPTGLLSDSDSYIIASIMRHLVHLNELDFCHCYFTSGTLQILWNNIEHSSVKIFRLVFSDGKLLESEACASVGKLVKKCSVNVLNIAACNITNKALENLLSALEGAMIPKLVITRSKLEDDSGYATLGKIVKIHAVEELVLDSSQRFLCEADEPVTKNYHLSLADENLKNLLSATEGAKISRLQISCDQFEDIGYVTLGKIVRICAVDELRLRYCQLNLKNLTNLLLGTEEAKISRLDVTCCHFSEDAAITLGDLVNQCSVEELTMCSCRLNDFFLETFVSRVRESKLTKLDARANFLSSATIKKIRNCIIVTNLEPCDHHLKIMQKLSLLKTKAEEIGPEGGNIDLHRCTLSLPHGAHQTRRLAQISVRSSYTDRPEGFFVVSPEVHCDTFGIPFEGLATISLPLHAMPEDGQVHIISKEEDHSEWKILDVHPTLTYRNVSFQVSYFRPFKAVIKRWSEIHFRRYDYVSASVLHGLTCIDDDVVLHACVDTLKCEELIKALSLFSNCHSLRSNQWLAFNYICRTPAESQLEPSHENLEVNDSIPLKLNLFALLPPPQKNIHVLGIQYKKPMTRDAMGVTSCTEFVWRTAEVGEGAQFSVAKSSLSSEKVEAVAGAGAVMNQVRIEEPGIPQTGAEPGLTVHESVRNVEVTKSTKEFFELHHSAVDVYQVDVSCTKGNVLIINNVFQGQGQGERPGSEVDLQNLKQLWNNLGFNVQTKTNLSAIEMRNACKEFAENTHNFSMLILIIMSHGDKENGKEFIFGEDMGRVSSDDILSNFTSTNSPHLKGIPKVFMFQACRGSQQDAIQKDALGEAHPEQMRDPNRADMLIAYPSQSGYVSYRDPQTGSRLMNAVVDVFKRRAHDQHILELLTEVNNVVSPEGGLAHSIQCSNHVSYLRKKLYLFPGWP